MRNVHLEELARTTIYWDSCRHHWMRLHRGQGDDPSAPIWLSDLGYPSHLSCQGADAGKREWLMPVTLSGLLDLDRSAVSSLKSYAAAGSDYAVPIPNMVQRWLSLAEKTVLIYFNSFPPQFWELLPV